MLKITNAFRWIYGIIFRKPTRFSWLIDGRLAGSDVPLTFSQYRWLLKQGIQTIVTVREKPLSPKWINQNIITTANYSSSNNQQKINYFHLKVKNKDVPSVEQLDNMVDYINNQVNNENRPVAVHCSGGKGRTGTMLAAYLIKIQHMNAREAMVHIRKVRPGSVESKRQELRLYEYKDFVYNQQKLKSEKNDG
jgi:atypical dual specificity phosphatase